MMIEDCAAKILFLDRETGEALEGVSGAGRATPVALDDSAAGEPLSRWLGPEGAKPAAVGVSPRLAVQHHLLVGHDRRAQGHRSAPCDALAAAQPGVVQGRGDARLDPALFEHHAGRLHSDFGAWGNGGSVAEIRRRGIPSPLREAPRDPRHAGPGPISPDHGASGLRPLRPVELPPEGLDERAFFRRVEGGRPQPLAGRPRRILRHDRRRRRDNARRP